MQGRARKGSAGMGWSGCVGMRGGSVQGGAGREGAGLMVGVAECGALDSIERKRSVRCKALQQALSGLRFARRRASLL